VPRNELNNGSAKAQQEYKMNTKNLKAYAPKARSQFIEAIKKRAAQFGIYEDKIADIQFEGGAAIIEGRAFTKKQGEQRKRLEQKVKERGYGMFIREISYTWFNRLAAIRYMELHDYFDHGFRVLSHPNSQDQLPEILDNASDVADMLALDKSHITELQLAGDKEEELYRELLLGQCHYLYKVMPFMFEKLDDATELLLPDNLTKTDSILKGLICDIPEEDWSDIEVIGWLYQFYISEHKDAVMGKVVKSEDIPAATQLFTPNWIVKYLVQNSLGRQWLATYPESELKGKMEYYIEPADQSDEVIKQLKAITPTSIDPEQIKILDPAAGSGHILVEVYEVLREIYLERGYRLREIPELILTKNIYGLDIDDRAAQLAGFALMMKAREDDRHIFERVARGDVQLNVYSLKSTETMDVTKLWQALNLEGNQHQGSTGGLFDELGYQPTGIIPMKSGIYKQYFELLQNLKSVFLRAKTLGSLIQIDSENLLNLAALKDLLQAKVRGSDPSAKHAATYLLPIINQAISLAQKYDAVIANPPYMGKKGMNADLKEFAKINFPNSKSDLFAMFMERAFGLLKGSGYNSQVNMQSWMFLSSYELLREWLLDTKTFITMAHLGARAFGQISGEVVQTTAWILRNMHMDSYKPVFFRLVNGNEEEKRNALINKLERFDQTQQIDFKLIPNYPIVYWVSDKFRGIYKQSVLLSNKAHSLQGMITGNNNKYLRLWSEVDYKKLSLNKSNINEVDQGKHPWIPYNKGGAPRKWYGNNEYVLNWSNGGEDLTRSRTQNSSYYLKPCITWTFISSTFFAARYCPNGFVWDVAGSSAFPNNEQDSLIILALMCSKLGELILGASNPTLNYQVENILALPIHNQLVKNNDLRHSIIENTQKLIEITKKDWDSYERSWDFKLSPLIQLNRQGFILSDVFKLYEDEVNVYRKSVLALEKSNLNLITSAYGLEKEIKTDISESEVTLTSNSLFRYSTSKIESDNKFKSNSIVELISYAIGCMMGRYSLNIEGLIFAEQNNARLCSLIEVGAFSGFSIDDDGIIPLASEQWIFEDDATARLIEFVNVVWGHGKQHENIEFISNYLCCDAIILKNDESSADAIRRYFSSQFYKDHCKIYKNRPIYWLFSSGKEKAFECLVYLHRYNEGTLARMRTEYVTPLMGKYDQQQSMLSEQIIEASNTEKRQIEKDLKSLEKKQAELRTFDEQLKHYAEMRITLDLDDGVKANYGKFGNLLADVKTIHGTVVK
jgi:type II restriction/modification system DNA methylase subunit YeeA